MTETIEKRRTRKQAAIAGVALTALIGGLLAVDVANRPVERVECVVDVSDLDVYEDYGDGTGGGGNSLGDPTTDFQDTRPETPQEYAKREDFQRAKDAFNAEMHRREAAKIAAGCNPSSLIYTI